MIFTAKTAVYLGACHTNNIEHMHVFFLHNHYIPKELRHDSIAVQSVIVPEFYPDLNALYLGEPHYFNTVEAYINHVIQHGYYSHDTPFAIENVGVLSRANIRAELCSLRKCGVRIIQLFCGRGNRFFDVSTGLSKDGIGLLAAISDLDLILDLSHIPDLHIAAIAGRFSGKMTVSHCACSELYANKTPRSNSLNIDSIRCLAKRNTLFGISFLNDIISSCENELDSDRILADILSQINCFINIAGADHVALGPDFIDTEYFSKCFDTKIFFPDVLVTKQGLEHIADGLSGELSADSIENIFSKNVERLFHLR